MLSLSLSSANRPETEILYCENDVNRVSHPSIVSENVRYVKMLVLILIYLSLFFIYLFILVFIYFFFCFVLFFSLFSPFVCVCVCVLRWQ